VTALVVPRLILPMANVEFAPFERRSTRLTVEAGVAVTAPRVVVEPASADAVNEVTAAPVIAPVVAEESVPVEVTSRVVSAVPVKVPMADWALDGEFSLRVSIAAPLLMLLTLKPAFAEGAIVRVTVSVSSNSREAKVCWIRLLELPPEVFRVTVLASVILKAPAVVPTALTPSTLASMRTVSVPPNTVSIVTPVISPESSVDAPVS